MTDEPLSEVGEQRLDELATDGDPLPRRVLDTARYHLLMLVQLLQTAAAFGMIASTVGMGAMPGDQVVWPLVVNAGVFLGAYLTDGLVKNGWWWTDG